jgi:hypothetical protein
MSKNIFFFHSCVNLYALYVCSYLVDFECFRSIFNELKITWSRKYVSVIGIQRTSYRISVYDIILLFISSSKILFFWIFLEVYLNTWLYTCNDILVINYTRELFFKLMVAYIIWWFDVIFSARKTILLFCSKLSKKSQVSE